MPPKIIIKSEKTLDFTADLTYNNKVAKKYAAMAQMVERVLGKDEVTGSIPVSSSRAPIRYVIGVCFLPEHLNQIKSGLTAERQLNRIFIYAAKISR